jgi:hypothetical protein
MAMPVSLKVEQISLAEAAGPHRRVSVIYGCVREIEWQHTHEQAIEYIENRLFAYHVLHHDRAVRLVVDRTVAGEKFLKTELDGEVPALLLQLPLRAAANHPA